MDALDRPIRTDRDLDATWRDLAGPWGFSVARVWVLLIDADGTVGHIMDIVDETPGEKPPARLMEGLVDLLARSLDEALPGGSVAVMRARPGSRSPRTLDDAWCRALHQALQKAPFTTWPVYFATDHSVGRVSADALIERSSG